MMKAVEEEDGDEKVNKFMDESDTCKEEREGENEKLNTITFEVSCHGSMVRREDAEWSIEPQLRAVAAKLEKTDTDPCACRWFPCYL
jgi:hypothetical protein